MKLRKMSAAVCGLVLAGAVAPAMADLSGNIGLTSDYVWRGVSQSDENFAASAGLDYSHSSGLYVGIWGSSVDFGSEADVEADVYGGFSGEAAGLSYDLGYIEYTYPNETGLNFGEGYVGLGYGPGSVKVSHDFDNDNTYYEGALSFDIGGGFGAGAHLGYYDFDKGTDYTDWKLGVTKSVGPVDLELAYTDTDMSKDDCGGVCGARAVLSATWTF